MPWLPKIEILMATYQGAPYLEVQLNSILNQTYSNCSLLIRDDGSKDETLEILRAFQSRFPERISLLPSGETRGVIGNFSTLLAHSTADYLLFADQDDCWHPDKVERTFRKMLELEGYAGKKTALLVHTDLAIVDAALQPQRPSFWKYAHLFPQAKQLSRLLMQNIVTGCTMMINRSLAEQAQPIPQEAMMHDWWLALAAAAFGEIGEVSEPTILYRQHGRNQLGAKDRRPLSLLLQGMKSGGEALQKGRLTFAAQQKQGEVFLKRFQTLLTEEQRQVLHAFLELATASSLRRTYLMQQHQLYKHGALRNAAFLLL